MRKLLNPAMRLLSTLALTLILTGCLTTRTKIVPSDKAAVALPRGKSFTPAVDGWFIPDARMYEIMNALDKARITSQ